jgi:hypothetical protein
MLNDYIGEKSFPLILVKQAEEGTSYKNPSSAPPRLFFSSRDADAAEITLKERRPRKSLNCAP